MISVTELFDTTTHHGSPYAQIYLQGLLSELAAKNMFRMQERIPGARQENLQQFLSDSPWSYAGLWQWVGEQATQQLGGQARSMLLIDESAHGKKGDKSVGVARQHNGRLGKTDNCQVGVYSALALETRATLTGCRLYLPEVWVQDRPRCLAVGIPEAEIRFRTKIELAQELVIEAQANGLEFAWVGIDAGYGRDQGFLCWVADRDLGFVADVPKDLLVWEKQPTMDARPDQLKASGARQVGALGKAWMAAGKGQHITLRVGENGPVKVKVWARRVWAWPAGQEQPRCWWLVVREDRQGEIKHTLCNAPAQTSLEELAILQGGRHFVERTFEDAKSHVGMGDYQVRKWLGWQHHMALVGLAMLFVLQERLLAEEEHPLLSVRDVVELMSWYFQTHPNLDKLMEAMEQRHLRRSKSKQAAQKREKRAEKAKKT
jgi:SRSO17 transposase